MSGSNSQRPRYSHPINGPSILPQHILNHQSSSAASSTRLLQDPYQSFSAQEFDGFVDSITSRIRSALLGGTSSNHLTSQPEHSNSILDQDVFGQITSLRPTPSSSQHTHISSISKSDSPSKKSLPSESHLHFSDSPSDHQPSQSPLPTPLQDDPIHQSCNSSESNSSHQISHKQPNIDDGEEFDAEDDEEEELEDDEDEEDEEELDHEDDDVVIVAKDVRAEVVSISDSDDQASIHSSQSLSPRSHVVDSGHSSFDEGDLAQDQRATSHHQIGPSVSSTSGSTSHATHLDIIPLDDDSNAESSAIMVPLAVDYPATLIESDSDSMASNDDRSDSHEESDHNSILESLNDHDSHAEDDADGSLQALSHISPVHTSSTHVPVEHSTFQSIDERGIAFPSSITEMDMASQFHPRSSIEVQILDIGVPDLLDPLSQSVSRSNSNDCDQYIVEGIVSERVNFFEQPLGSHSPTKLGDSARSDGPQIVSTDHLDVATSKSGTPVATSASGRSLERTGSFSANGTMIFRPASESSEDVLQDGCDDDLEFSLDSKEAEHLDMGTADQLQEEDVEQPFGSASDHNIDPNGSDALSQCVDVPTASQKQTSILVSTSGCETVPVISGQFQQASAQAPIVIDDDDDEDAVDSSVHRSDLIAVTSYSHALQTKPVVNVDEGVPSGDDHANQRVSEAASYVVDDNDLFEGDRDLRLHLLGQDHRQRFDAIEELFEDLDQSCRSPVLGPDQDEAHGTASGYTDPNTYSLPHLASGSRDDTTVESLMNNVPKFQYLVQRAEAHGFELEADHAGADVMANGPSDHDAISSLFDDFFQMPTPNSSASATPSSGPAPPTPMTILTSLQNSIPGLTFPSNLEFAPPAPSQTDGASDQRKDQPNGSHSSVQASSLVTSSIPAWGDFVLNQASTDQPLQADYMQPVSLAQLQSVTKPTEQRTWKSSMAYPTSNPSDSAVHSGLALANLDVVSPGAVDQDSVDCSLQESRKLDVPATIDPTLSAQPKLSSPSPPEVLSILDPELDEVDMLAPSSPHAVQNGPSTDDEVQGCVMGDVVHQPDVVCAPEVVQLLESESLMTEQPFDTVVQSDTSPSDTRKTNDNPAAERAEELSKPRPVSSGGLGPIPAVTFAESPPVEMTAAYHTDQTDEYEDEVGNSVIMHGECQASTSDEVHTPVASTTQGQRTPSVFSERFTSRGPASFVTSSAPSSVASSDATSSPASVAPPPPLPSASMGAPTAALGLANQMSRRSSIDSSTHAEPPSPSTSTRQRSAPITKEEVNAPGLPHIQEILESSSVTHLHDDTLPNPLDPPPLMNTFLLSSLPPAATPHTSQASSNSAQPPSPAFSMAEKVDDLHVPTGAGSNLATSRIPPNSKAVSGIVTQAGLSSGLPDPLLTPAPTAGDAIRLDDLPTPCLQSNQHHSRESSVVVQAESSPGPPKSTLMPECNINAAGLPHAASTISEHADQVEASRNLPDPNMPPAASTIPNIQLEDIHSAQLGSVVHPVHSRESSVVAQPARSPQPMTATKALFSPSIHSMMIQADSLDHSSLGSSSAEVMLGSMPSHISNDPSPGPTHLAKSTEDVDPELNEKNEWNDSVTEGGDVATRATSEAIVEPQPDNIESVIQSQVTTSSIDIHRESQSRDSLNGEISNFGHVIAKRVMTRGRKSAAAKDPSYTPRDEDSDMERAQELELEAELKRTLQKQRPRGRKSVASKDPTHTVTTEDAISGLSQELQLEADLKTRLQKRKRTRDSIESPQQPTPTSPNHDAEPIAEARLKSKPGGSSNPGTPRRVYATRSRQSTIAPASDVEEADVSIGAQTRRMRRMETKSASSPYKPLSTSSNRAASPWVSKPSGEEQKIPTPLHLVADRSLERDEDDQTLSPCPPKRAGSANPSQRSRRTSVSPSGSSVSVVVPVYSSDSQATKKLTSKSEPKSIASQLSAELQLNVPGLTQEQEEEMVAVPKRRLHQHNSASQMNHGGLTAIQECSMSTVSTEVKAQAPLSRAGQRRRRSDVENRQPPGSQPPVTRSHCHYVRLRFTRLEGENKLNTFLVPQCATGDEDVKQRMVEAGVTEAGDATVEEQSRSFKIGIDGRRLADDGPISELDTGTGGTEEILVDEETMHLLVRLVGMGLIQEGQVEVLVPTPVRLGELEGRSSSPLRSSVSGSTTGRRRSHARKRKSSHLSDLSLPPSGTSKRSRNEK